MPVCRLCYPARGAAEDVLDAAASPAGASRASPPAGYRWTRLPGGGGRCGEGLSPLLGVREGVHRWRENWQEVMRRG
jgi:hypothetical protein